jgi:hypothetical protein
VKKVRLIRDERENLQTFIAFFSASHRKAAMNEKKVNHNEVKLKHGK